MENNIFEDPLLLKQKLLEAIQKPVIATTVNGEIKYWNKPAEDLFGWKSKDVLGKSIVEITPSNQTAQQATEIMKLLQNGQSWTGEFALRKKSGEEFAALVTDSPIFDDNDQLVGIVGVTVDLTNEMNLRKRVEEKNKELEELNKTMIGRELKMIELKDKIEELGG